MAATHETVTEHGLLASVEQLASGAVSSTELTTSALERISSSQLRLNCFRRLRAEDALAEAAEADRRIADGANAPLLGVPIAVKDDTDIAGLPTAFGCAGEFPPAPADAELVRRLKQAGAVIVGKTNTPEIGQWPFTEGSAFGVTRNPWHAQHTPGGSSGGSAAAVAAGLVPAAVGSDGAGSVRIPSAWNHLVGIKTQRGTVPTPPEPEQFHGLTVHGPLAKRVADAASLLDVLTGSNGTHRAAAQREPGRLRIGLSVRIPFTATKTTLSPQVHNKVAALAHRLAALGHDVVEIEPRYRLIGLNFLPRSLAGVRDWTKRVPASALLDPRTRSNARTGSLLGHALRLAKLTEPLLHKQIGAVFDTVDVLLTPTTATPPPPIGTFDGLSGWQTDQAMIAACPYAWPWNVLGWPGVNVPAGLTDEGLPLGAQLLGPAHSERLLISLSAQLEAAERWYERRAPSVA